MKTTIRVTQEDIDAGERHSCHSCPLAIAINRTLGAGDAMVGWGTVEFETQPDGENEFRLPEIAVEFYERFDECLPVEPFAFTLRLEEPLPADDLEDEDEDAAAESAPEVGG